jgi:transposase-like protein
VAAPASASPELSDRPRRRTFTTRDRLRILADIDRAAGTGGIGVVLRSEGLYSSTLSEWRRQRDDGAFDALSPVRRGPKTTEASPLTAEVARLHSHNAQLTQRLARAEAIIDIQKRARVAGPPVALETVRAILSARGAAEKFLVDLTR